MRSPAADDTAVLLTLFASTDKGMYTIQSVSSFGGVSRLYLQITFKRNDYHPGALG